MWSPAGNIRRPPATAPYLERHCPPSPTLGLSRPDGRLRRARYLSGLLHAARAVSGPDRREYLGKRPAPACPVRTADELSASCRIARSMIFGKVYNARWSIERTRRDHGLRLDSASLTASASHLKELLPQIAAAASLEHLRGLEGAGATLYFGQFDQLILGEKPLFSYQSRSRRPPRDPVNALLSFVYSLLSHDCASALESVGLDSRGLSPPGSPRPGLSGPGSDGGAAPLYGRPVRFNPDKQPNSGAAGL